MNGKKKCEKCRNYMKIYYQFHSDTNQLTADHRPKHLVDHQYQKNTDGM